MKLTANIRKDSHNIWVLSTWIAVEEAIQPKLIRIYFLLWP